MALQEEFEQQGNWLFRRRSYIPFLVIAAGIPVYLWVSSYSEDFFLKGSDFAPVYDWICVLISLLGLAIRVYTVGHASKNTSGRNVKEQVADSLNTSGIYSVVRHPLYLGNFFMWLGPVMFTGHIWFIVAVCLFYWIYYERIMYAEEQFLRRKFGDSYLSWSEGVPAFMPAFRKFRKSKLGFSWKFVLKKEKNGLAAVFIIFCLLDVLGELVTGYMEFNYVLMALCFLTSLFYLVLKYLKHKTQVLNESDR
ncbi:MAG: DUF1295 domain-containing protein [Bacteroidales bacterium]|nr:DUF1295 domain-containing protein [Bacteroidales bacterium]